MDVNPIRNRKNIRYVMADQYYGNALSSHSPDEFEHLTGLANAQRCRWLIQNYYFASPSCSSRDGHRLALTA